MGTGIKNNITNQQDIEAQRICNPPRLLSKRLYNIKEGAVYLGRTVWAVREMLWAGKMPYVKDGKRILIDLRDMDEWIDKSKTRSIY
jgi:excisionase family DNA binding protein